MKMPSRTQCLAFVVALAPAVKLLYPPAGTLLEQNPEIVCSGIALVFGAIDWLKNRGGSTPPPIIS